MTGCKPIAPYGRKSCIEVDSACINAHDRFPPKADLVKGATSARPSPLQINHSSGDVEAPPAAAMPN